MNTTRTKDRNNTEKTHQLGDSGIKEKYGAIENSPNGKVIKYNGTDIQSKVCLYIFIILFPVFYVFKSFNLENGNYLLHLFLIEH